MDCKPKFARGRLVRHKKFAYRGVVVDVDATFQGSDEWYEQVARSRPPRDKPWYRVLVHNATHETYVAERHLAPDPSGDPVEHPALAHHFDELRDGVYARTRLMN